MSSASLTVFLLATSVFGLAQGINPAGKYSEAILSVEAKGAILFELDTAAAKATDEVFWQTHNAAKKELRGWISEKEGATIRTYFIVQSDDQSYAIKYSVETKDGQIAKDTFKVFSPLAIMNDEQKRQFLARQLALKSITQPCSSNYNTVTLPTGKTGFVVYALPATEKRDVVLAGGYFSFQITDDATTVTSTHAFSKSCLELPKPANAKGLFTTHILDEYPTEIHIYLSLANKIDLFVCTVQNRFLWAIENGRVRFVEELKAKS